MAFFEVNRLISERIPIDKIILRYVKLEPTATGFKGLCPFHKEKTPSFHVNTSEGYYYCFGCQATGNVITFIMEKEGYSFSDAVKKLAEEYNIKELLQNSFDPDSAVAKEREDIFISNKEAAVYFHNALINNDRAWEYLLKRGVNEESVKKFGIGFIGSGDDFIKEMNRKGIDNNSLRRSGLIKLDKHFNPQSFFYNRIMIPIVSGKKVIGFGGRVLEGDGPKYINSPDTAVFNKKENLFGIDFVRNGLKDFPYVVLCEGYFDVIAMHTAGFKTAVAALGTAVTSVHLDIMSRFRKPVVVFLDGDEAGRKAAARITKLKIPDNIDLRVAFIKEEGADPDSVLREKSGKEKVRKLIETAKPLFQELIDEQLKIYNEKENLEEKIKIENTIRTIVKAIPRRKFRTYSLYIQKNSENGIKIMYDRNSAVDKLKNEARKENTTDFTKQNEEKLKIKKIIVIACLYPSYIPACAKMMNIFVPLNLGLIVEKMLDLYYEDGDIAVILDEIDPQGEMSSEFENMEVEFIDKTFVRLQAFLLRTQNERTIKILKNETSADAVKNVQKLIDENRKLRKIEQDNFIGIKTGI